MNINVSAKNKFLDVFYKQSISGKAALLEALFWELNSNEKLLQALIRFRKEKGSVLPWGTE